VRSQKLGEVVIMKKKTSTCVIDLEWVSNIMNFGVSWCPYYRNL